MVTARSLAMSPSRTLGLLPIPPDHEVHVWITLLSQVGSDLSALSDRLSPEEKQKAARFLRAEDRERYIVAHGGLRELLGRYLSTAPAELEFEVNAFGKPSLCPRQGVRPLSFNLAHSGDVVLYGITGGRPVGVDVEAIRADLNVLELAQGQFSTPEVGALQATRPSEQTAAFFRCWTRKEAYVKARGEGLGFPLKQFSVCFGDNEPPAVQWAADDPSASERWSVFDVVPTPGYAGAVVVEGKTGCLVSRHWTPK